MEITIGSPPSGTLGRRLVCPSYRMRLRLAAILPVLAATLAVGLLGLALPGTAAAKSCARQVIDDWSQHGELTRTYPISCLRAALDQVPEDLRDYSNITDDIQAALQAQLDRRANLDRAKRFGIPDSSNAGPNRSLQVHPPPSLYRRAIDNLGTTSADSIPIPLLVLASLGGLLLLSAAGMTATRRIRAVRARRSTPPSP
jgi:hypothetical protein